MGTNKDETPESENRDIYEETVLNFLDQEMAAGQSNNQQSEQRQEVDELVTDLLKQVFTESDQQEVSSSDLQDILAEFPSSMEGQQDGGQGAVSGDSEDPSSRIPPVMEAEEIPPAGGYLESSHETQIYPEEVEQYSTADFMPETAPSQAPVSLGALGLGMNTALRRKIPVVAGALICLLIGIGVAIYHFRGSSKSVADTLESKPASPAAVTTENPSPIEPLVAEDSNTNSRPASRKPNLTKPKSASSAQKETAAEKIPPKPAAKSTTASSGNSASAPAQKSPTPKPGPAVITAANSTADPVSSTETMPVIRRFSTTQPSVPSPLTATSNLAIDKLTPPPMPDRITPANQASGRNPELPASAILTGIENANPTTQSPAPATEEPGNLVPSVLISKAVPVYPELAIRSRISGSVVLDLQIDETGKVVRATPVSGPAMLYSEAVKAAMKCSYRPASINGSRVSSRSRITMVFNLK